MAPPNTYEERSTPGLGDDADMDADDQLSQDGGASAASTSAGAHHHLASGSNATGRGATSVRTRITVVCAECKRLKLRCDRRTPCGSCVKRETVTRCTYSAAASEKIDVQSVHNATVSQMNLITALYRALGIPEDQMEQLMNAQSFPPHDGYELPIDSGKVRALLVGAKGGDDLSSSSGTSAPGPSTEGRRRPTLDPASHERWRKMVHDGFLVAFSQPPSMGSPPPTMDRFGEPTGRRQQGRASLSSLPAATPSAAARAFLNTAHRPPYSSLGSTMARTAVDLASRVFQANSVLIPTEFEGALRLWCGAMGWEPRAVNECAVPASTFITNGGHELGVDSGNDSRPSSSGRDQEKRRKKDVIPIVAPYSELDYHDAQRPKDLLAVGIAYQLFVGPATQAAMAAAGFGAPSIPGGQSATYPFTFSALGGVNNAAQPNSPQLPNSPFGTHPNVASQPTSPPAPHITPPTTTSGGSSSNPARQSLLTPQHILAHLPSKEWRAVLLTEFESFMIVHEGVCGANRSLWRRRIERMFEWAEHFAERNGANGGAVAQGDSGAESGSQVSSSSHSGPGSSRAGKRKGKARSNAAMSTSGAGSGSSEHSLPPPPTMGLFAVACGVFAIGALCYACKATHGFNEAPRAEGKRKEMEVDPSAQKDGSSEAGGSVSSSVAAMPPPSLPFSVSFSLTGGGAGSAAAPLTIPGTTATKPNPLIHSLPPSYAPHVLHSLQRATIIAHDHLDLPPSLDLIYAHVLGWLYLMHPSDSLSNVTNNGFDTSVRGVGGGAVTVVEPVIWKELGKCINIARGMGLGVVDDDGHGDRKIRKRKGVLEDEDDWDKEDSYAEKMGLWEREMRRRIWWELSWFDLWISESMGHAPLIFEDTSSSTKIPSDVDESSFDPTSSSIPAPAIGSAPGMNLAHFVAKCRLQLLMRELPRQPIKDAVTGELSIDAAQAFEAKVNAWKVSLPDTFSIIFGSTVEETKFPSADVSAMQACDLHIMANALVMRLWFPFVKDFLGRPSLQSHQNAALACSTAANSIIVASKYMITRFRSTHPLHFGFYSFGRNVWLAATLLASILISMPQIIWAATCRKGLDVALSIARDQLLSGKLENGVNPKYEVIQLLQQLKSMAERFSNAAGGLPTGSKRKADEHVETVKMRHGFQIPFVGLAAVSAAGEIDVPLGRHETFQRSVSVNVPRTFTVPVDPLPSEDMEVSEEPAPSRPNPLPMPKTVRTRTTSQPAWPESSPSPYIVGANNGEYVPPAAATSFPPKNKVAKTPSEISQTSSLQGKSAPIVTSKRSFPVIGIRDRTKAGAKQPLQQDSGSSTEKGRSASESGPSRAKRPKSSSGGREGTPNSGVPSPAGRASQLQQTYPQPTPESATPAPGVMVSSVPPPIQQTAPPQPTYYAPPSRHVQSAAMSDVGSQVSIGGAGPAAQYRQTGPGSDYSSAFSAAPRNHQPQDYSMSMHSQGSNQQSSGYQQVQAREYGLPVAPHSNYMVDDALSTFSGGGSDYYTASVTNNSTYHHGPGSAVGTLAYTQGNGDGQAYGSAPQQQQEQHQMHIMSQHQNTNGYGSHQHYQSQTTQHTPSQPNFAQFAEPAPPQSQGWTTQDTNGSQLSESNIWHRNHSDAFDFGDSIA